MVCFPFKNTQNYRAAYSTKGAVHCQGLMPKDLRCTDRSDTGIATLLGNGAEVNDVVGLVNDLDA